MIRPRSFAQAEAAGHSAIQDEFAEPFIFTPMITKPNFPPCPDPSRVSKLVRMAFFWDNKEMRLGLRETQVTSRKPCGSISICDFADPIKRGDTFTSCRTGDTFETTKIERDGLTGLSLEFVQLGVQS